NMDTTVAENTRETIKNTVNEFNFSTYFTHKFKKKGRSFTFDGQFRRNEMIGDGYLFSTVKNSVKKDTTEYNPIESTDQRKDRNSKNDVLSASVSYTEPLSKVWNLVIGTGIESSNSSSRVGSFNKDADGEYNELDSRFSNDYNFDRRSSRYKLAIVHTTEKLKFTVANNFNNDKLEQYNNNSKQGLSRSYFTYNPNVSAGYSFSKTKGLCMYYSEIIKLS